MKHATKMILKHQNSIYVNGPKKMRNDFRIPTPPKIIYQGRGDV